MRVLVSGSHVHRNPLIVWVRLSEFHAAIPIDVIIEGGALGVDRFASAWSWLALGKRSQRFNADWQGLGRKAGPIRNTQMLVEGRPDVLIAFPLGGAGTQDMIDQALAPPVRLPTFIWRDV